MSFQDKSLLCPLSLKTVENSEHIHEGWVTSTDSVPAAVRGNAPAWMSAPI